MSMFHVSKLPYTEIIIELPRPSGRGLSNTVIIGFSHKNKFVLAKALCLGF